jgi:hypothetical protein
MSLRGTAIRMRDLTVEVPMRMSGQTVEVRKLLGARGNESRLVVRATAAVRSHCGGSPTLQGRRESGTNHLGICDGESLHRLEQTPAARGRMSVDDMMAKLQVEQEVERCVVRLAKAPCSADCSARTHLLAERV